MNKKYIYGSKRNCVICAIEFTPRDKGSKQNCCSNKCRGIQQTRRALKICPICKKEFLPSIAKYTTCSRSCGAIYKRSRKIKDPMVNIRKKIASRCCSFLHRTLRGKPAKTYELLGYTPNELIAHLESLFKHGMCWENYGNKKDCWSIDHKKPISHFNKNSTIAEINALSNLEPIWHVENCRKGNKWSTGG